MLALLALLACSDPDPLAELRAMDARLADAVAALAAAERALLGDAELTAPEPPAPDATGVTLAMGLRILELVDRRYVVAPDWAALARAGDRAAREVPGAPALEPAAVASREAAGRRLAAHLAGDAHESAIVARWIAGALSSLDPHTRAVWPAEVAGWEAHHEGVYVGVGVELADRDGVRVRWPVPGSPAFEAGLRQGDLVARVGGEPVTTSQEAAARLRGPEGTRVAVDLMRDGAPLRVELARRPITPDTVVGWARTPDNSWDPWLDRDAGVAYARVLAFRPHTDEALDALLEPVAGEVRAIVLDLRGCPGGDLDAAAQLADRFVDRGTLVRLEGRDLPPPPPEGVVAWNEAVEGHALEGLPVAVLVDEATASSAEIVAGALDVLADAVIVGAPTFGKASSQVLLPVEDLGFAVQITNLRWTLPDGAPLDGGLRPDEALPLGLAGTYQVDLMRRRLEHVRAHADGSPIVVDLPTPREDLPVLGADPHVVRALLRLREHLLAGGGGG